MIKGKVTNKTYLGFSDNFVTSDDNSSTRSSTTCKTISS